MTRQVAPADERRHTPGPEPLWGESWYFDFAAPDGSLGGFVRLGLHPNQGLAWWWAFVVGEGRPLVSVRDHEVPLPRGRGLEIRTEGLWAELTCETPHEHWTVGMEAFGVALEDPADAYRGERGERIPVGLDLEWEEAGPVHGYGRTARYGQPCRVHGEVLLGAERREVDAHGERDHSWGVADWWSAGWVWTAGRLDDGTAFHAAGTGAGGAAPHDGFVLAPGADPVIPDRFSVDTVAGDEGLPLEAGMRLGPLELRVAPLAHAPVLVVAGDGRTARVPRSLCRFSEAGGASGHGWTEWNQPGPG